MEGTRPPKVKSSSYLYGTNPPNKWSTHSDLDDKPFEICLNYAIDQKYILKL